MWKVDSNFIVRTYFYKLSNPSHLNYRISPVNYLIILSYRLFLDIFHNELYKFHSIRSISEALSLSYHPFMSRFIAIWYLIFHRELTTLFILFTLSRDFSSVHRDSGSHLLLLLLLQATRYLRFNPEQWKSVTITSC